MSAATVVGGNGAPAAPSMGEPLAKKKRGRPRKYGPDGSMALAMVPASAASGSPATGQGFSGPFSPPALNPASSLVVASPDGFKKRGRPKGSTNKPRVDAAGKISTPIIICTDSKVLVWFVNSNLLGTGEVLVDSFIIIYQDKNCYWDWTASRAVVLIRVWICFMVSWRMYWSS
jgi:hypothetical protein